MAEPVEPVARWRIILAFILDAFTSFMVLGYLIGAVFGGATENGFALSGWRALLLLGLMIVYFVVGGRTGGTIWQRVLGAQPR